MKRRRTTVILTTLCRSVHQRDHAVMRRIVLLLHYGDIRPPCSSNFVATFLHGYKTLAAKDGEDGWPMATSGATPIPGQTGCVARAKSVCGAAERTSPPAGNTPPETPKAPENRTPTATAKRTTGRGEREGRTPDPQNPEPARKARETNSGKREHVRPRSTHHTSVLLLAPCPPRHAGEGCRRLSTKTERTARTAMAALEEGHGVCTHQD